MTETNVFRTSPYRAIPMIKDILEAGLVPYLKSSPGMGKSATAEVITNDFNLKMVDHRISTSAPTDLTGLPEIVNGRSRFNPFDIFPIESDEVPKGKNGWLLFLDEFNSGSKSVQAAAYKLILDKMVGQHRLHQNVGIMCAGNLETDRAIVTQLSTAMQSRLITLIFELDADEFINQVMIKQQWDSRIIAYLSYKHSAIMDFRPDHSDSTFCCPRTWDFLQRMTKGKPIVKTKMPLYTGTITSGVAVDFVNFTEISGDMPKFDDIILEPQATRIPTSPMVKWATTTHLAEKVEPKNFEPLCKYMNRMDMEFRICFFRMVLPHKPELRTHQYFPIAAQEFAKYLHD